MDAVTPGDKAPSDANSLAEGDSAVTNAHTATTPTIEDTYSRPRSTTDEDPITTKKAAIYDHVLEVLTSNVYGNLVNQGAASGKDGRLNNLGVYVELKQMLEDDKAQRERLMAMMTGEAVVEGKRKGRNRGLKEQLSATEARLKEVEAEKVALLDKVKEVERQRDELRTNLTEARSKYDGLEERLVETEDRCTTAENRVKQASRDPAPDASQQGNKAVSTQDPNDHRGQQADDSEHSDRSTRVSVTLRRWAGFTNEQRIACAAHTDKLRGVLDAVIAKATLGDKFYANCLGEGIWEAVECGLSHVRPLLLEVMRVLEVGDWVEITIAKGEGEEERAISETYGTARLREPGQSHRASGDWPDWAWNHDDDENDFPSFLRTQPANHH